MRTNQILTLTDTNSSVDFESTTLAKDTVPSDGPFSEVGQEKRLHFIKEKTSVEVPFLTGRETFSSLGTLKGNIENFIGMSQVPTGIIGPLNVHGSGEKGSFYVPLATTEGALVASYARGARACQLSGEIRSVCLMEGVQRAPFFEFENLDDVIQFIHWVDQQRQQIEIIISSTSKFARLSEVKYSIDGNQLIIIFHFTTADASGQNMVTIATQAICEYIEMNSPIPPKTWYLESNCSGDKKATYQSFSSVRGKKVSAEIVLKKDIIERVLKTSAQKMFKYWQTSFMGAVKCGAIGAQGHFANGLAALFIATGQDVACVSESSVGITRMEVAENDGLYCSVTLPNLIVGTIGGGTGLPTQRECLQLMGCEGNGKAVKFAEIAAALCLAGEISIIAALSVGDFAAAHQKHGRA